MATKKCGPDTPILGGFADGFSGKYSEKKWIKSNRPWRCKKNLKSLLDIRPLFVTPRLKEELAELKAARSRVLKAQSYGHGSRSLTRVSYADLQREIKELERRIAMYDLDGAIAGSTPVFGDIVSNFEQSWTRGMASLIGLFAPGTAMAYMHRRQALASYAAASTSGPNQGLTLPDGSLSKKQNDDAKKRWADKVRFHEMENIVLGICGQTESTLSITILTRS